MAYVGQGIKNGTFSVLDTSGNTYNGSNTTFNLGTQVGSPAQLLVSHDGVIQKPVTDYTIATGGTQITFTTAPASGASIFITEISGAVGGPMNRDINGDELILDADGDTSITADTDDQIDIRVSGTDQLTIKDGALSPVTDNDIDLGTTSLEFKNVYVDGTIRTDAIDFGTTTMTLPTGDGSANQFIKTDGSGTLSFAAAGGDLTPSFCAKLSSNQSFTDDTATLAALATELWDTDSAFTNTAGNYKFTVPTGEGGNYCFWAATNIGALGDGEEIQLLFYKNGSNDAVGNTRVWSAASGVGVYINAMFFKVLAEDDYMQLYISASDGNHFDASMTQFGGFKLLGT